ncbi:MAG: polysaccharide pyruvyl transferase family protein [Clostridiales bacterium]|jgi:polysaccharide pyruvyl transferase WcaK-like protein|nr:polysaccharide pyruvyl transferase family protein [Clostridiales bacterium]
MGRKIGFTGPFSDTNLGDYAMLVNVICDVAAKDDSITLFTYHGDFVRRIAADYLMEYSVTVCEIEVLPERGCASVLKRGLRRVGLWSDKRPAPVPIELLNRLGNSDQVYRAVAQLDRLVITGGGYLNAYWSCGPRRDDLIAMLIPALVANQFGKKIVFAGNSVGPFDQSEEFFFNLFHVLHHASFGVRDTVYSRANLLRLGIPEQTISYVPDDLLFLNPKLGAGRPDYPIPRTPYVVMELYQPVSYLQECAQSLFYFQEQMKKRYGLSMVLLPFDKEEGGMNQARFLQENCPDAELYDLDRTGYLPIEDGVRLIANAQLVLSNRYHALVLSVGAGVPVVQVLKDVCGDKRYYYSKGYGVLKEVFRGIPFDEREYLKTNLPQTLEELLLNYPVLRESQLKRYGAGYRENMRYLQSLRTEYYRRHMGESR